MEQQQGYGVDQLPPPQTRPDAAAETASPQINRVSSYRAVRVLVALVALVALAAITLVLGVVGPNRWILIALCAGGAAGLVFGAVAMQILQPAPPPRRSGRHDDGPSPWEQFLRELDRCRRYDLMFTLARIPCPPPPEPEHAGRGRARRPRRERLGDLDAALRPHLRSTDLTWADGPFIYALLPGIDHDACRGLLDRVGTRSPGLISPSGVTYASFPEDGLTGNALLAALDKPVPGTTRHRSAS